MTVRSDSLRWKLGCGAALAAAVALTACASPAEEPSTVAAPWEAEIRALYEESTSDFVRGIVADGQITTAEARESVARVNECFAQFDFVAEMLPEGGIEWMLNPDTRWASEAEEFAARDAAREIVMDCAARYGGGIPDLYDSMQRNPANVPWTQLIVDCLVRHNLVPAGFTEADYLAAISDGCVIPESVDEAMASPCWVTAWEIYPDEEWSARCRVGFECRGFGNIVAERNPDHPGEPIELPGGIRLGWPSNPTEQEQQATACQINPMD